MMMMMKETQYSFFRVIKETLKIPYGNLNFIVFSFLTTLPLFTFMLINDFIIQQTIIRTAKILTQTLNLTRLSDFQETPLGPIENKIFLLVFTYLVVLHLLDFLNTVAIVDSASVIYKGETPMKLMVTCNRPIKETRLKGPLIRYICTSILASFVFLGLISLAVHIFVIAKEVFFLIVYVVLFVALLIKSVEWSVLWNMSIVISVLEKKHGDIALVLTSCHSRGSRKFGSFFMPILFVLSFALRVSCLYMGRREERNGNGIGIASAYVGLVCLGNIFKWLVFVVYFYNWKNQRQERVDLDVGLGRAALAVKGGYDQGSSSI